MDEKTIFIVEDNKDDEALILRALKKNNINSKCKIARDGMEALELLFDPELNIFEKEENPSLILLDLKLPKKSGIEVLEEIKKNEKTKCIPTVILSTSNEESDIKKSYELNANSYIRKPVDFLEFIDVIKSLSNYWLNLNLNIPV